MLDISTLVIDLITPTTLYAGTNGGGVFKSTNAGESWSAVNVGLSNRTQPSIAALAIAPAPNTSTTLYAGMAAWGGAFKSTDGGETWGAINTGLTNTYVEILVIDPYLPTTLYAGTHAGVFKSTNSGESWREINTGLPRMNIHALVKVPQAGNDAPLSDTLYVGTENCVYKSTDGGESWRATPVCNSLIDQRISTLVIALPLPGIDPITPTTLYIGTANNGGVFKSTDGGETWSAINIGFNVGRGTDTTLQILSMAIDPTRPDTLYVGTWSGVFKSTDGGRTWKSVNTGLSATEVYALTVDPFTPTTLYAGTRGNGVFRSTDGGEN
jgi:hypothetical protein